MSECVLKTLWRVEVCVSALLRQGKCGKCGGSLSPQKNKGARGAQWNPKYGCKGTVTTRFALTALVAWKYSFDSTLRKLSVHPKYG